MSAPQLIPPIVLVPRVQLGVVPGGPDVFVASSGQLSPFGIQQRTLQTYRVSNAPVPSGPVTLRFAAIANLQSDANTRRYVQLLLSGTFIVDLFDATGRKCPAAPDLATVTIPAPQWINAIRNGSVLIAMSLRSSTPNCFDTSWISVDVEYPFDRPDQQTGQPGHIGWESYHQTLNKGDDRDPSIGVPTVMPAQYQYDRHTGNAVVVHGVLGGQQLTGKTVARELLPNGKAHAFTACVSRGRLRGVQVRFGSGGSFIIVPGGG